LEVSKPEYYCYTSEQREKEMILKKLHQEQDKSFVETLKSM